MVYDGKGAYFVTEGMEDMMNGVRTAGGQFAPGASGNPAGRPRGARSAAVRGMEAMLQDKHEALTKAAIDKALAGDVGALRLCLNRLAPVGRDAPVPFDMPPVRNACEVMEASAALMKAVGDGEVTPDEAERVMALLKEHDKMIRGGLFVPYVGRVCFENFR